MKNKYTKRVLLAGLLVGSQAFANNTINTTVDTPNSVAVLGVHAFHKIAIGENTQQTLTIEAENPGISENGNELLYTIEGGDACSSNNERVLCGVLATNIKLEKAINDYPGNDRFKATLSHKTQASLSLVSAHMNPGDSGSWKLSGAVDALDAVAQVVSFAPTISDHNHTYTISINNRAYSTTVDNTTALQAIVEALEAEMSSSPAVTCTENDIKIQCTAVVPGVAYTYSVLTTPIMQGDNPGWGAQRSVVGTALAHAEIMKTAADSALSNDSSLALKLEAVEEAESAISTVFTELEKLKSLKNDSSGNVETITNFQAAYDDLDTAIKALRVQYTEKADEYYALATLTGSWKFPIVKGLNYTTSTHTGVTDETGGFKCQPAETVTFSIESLELTTIPCSALVDSQTSQDTKNTNSVSLDTTSVQGFKDWKDEAGKQVIITKVLFGLFGDSIKTAFSQDVENLKFVTAVLTDEQKARTVGEALDANNLNLLVQNILDTTEAVTLPTDVQANYMLNEGWKASTIFADTVVPDPKVITINSQTRAVKEESALDTNVGVALFTTGIVEKFEIISGNDEGYFKINNTGQLQVAKEGLDFETTNTYTLKVKITAADVEAKEAVITITITDVVETPAAKKGSSSTAGCAYNPNAKGGSGIELVLFLVLSAYYLMRRKRLAIK